METIYDLNSNRVISLVNENPTSYHNIIKNKYRNFYNQIMTNFEGKSISEKLYRYCYPENINICQTCKINQTGFLEFTTGYRKYCSRYCTSHSDAQKSGTKKYLSDPGRIKNQVSKSRATCLERYGKEHWKKTAQGRKQTSDTSGKIIKERYKLSVAKRKHKQQYVYQIRALTEQVYRQYKEIIDPTEKRSFDWVIDHIYSIHDGYANQVPIEIISHWTNLKIVSRKDNSSKGAKSAITLEELYLNYNLAIQDSPISSMPVPFS